MEEMLLAEPVREVIAPLQLSESTLSIVDIVRDQPPARNVVEGLLQVRRSGFLRHTWKHIHCSLEDRILKCSFRADDKFPKYFINFDLISVDVKIKDNELYISPRGSSKVFGFTTIVTSSFKVWAAAILEAIATSRGSMIPQTHHTAKRRWWKRCSVTYNQFCSHVETGDLLLFQSKSATSMALRVATRSNYDHVAFLFPTDTGDIFLIESLGRTGVQIISLDWFISNCWHLLYKRIVHRKLFCNRDSIFYSLFKIYTKAWEGRPYKLNTRKLVRKKSFEEEYDDFFCSQLVAGLYKKLDLLPDEISCCNYWPANFTSARSLPLRPPAYLGEERVIKF